MRPPFLRTSQFPACRELLLGILTPIMELYLVRHGQSQANAGLTDHLDSDLTEIGQLQGARTGERLHSVGLTRAYVSPFRRTLETISYICAASDLRAEVTADACEYFSARWPGYRTFRGLAPGEITTEFPFAFLGHTFACEPRWWPQEPEDDKIIYDRAVRVRDALLRQFAGSEQRIVLVSHAETVGRLIEAFLRVPPNPDNPPWSNNCGISHLSCPAGLDQPATPITINDTSHLAEMIT